eukprot:CAMPEP_0170547294 /NCGR_PEP_ID=MMETSP0211-20121228/5663_1 /TAXON_ID=311385 /ORGANISM="Pseudokeronopsis sp., Strain OXSARD2" /LENGTH=55 /DNA_ID=CAMNT_0010852227 /DNA_START=297 /DNA_END=464 /DNA_ORIENTATION=-
MSTGVKNKDGKDLNQNLSLLLTSSGAQKGSEGYVENDGGRREAEMAAYYEKVRVQ